MVLARANARRCMDLAATVKYSELRPTFLELADKWTKLAIELEKPRLASNKQCRGLKTAP
jgi:hypothetical protein